MKASDLRVGNWISDRGGKEWQIDHWESANKVSAKIPNMVFDGVEMQGHPLTEDVDYLKPIPLTEEWHNKFGVELNGHHRFLYKIRDDIAVSFWGDYAFLVHYNQSVEKPTTEDNVCNLWNKDIKKRDMYVHEWQNLYHALTGEELTHGK
jgi:hypothetical protein